MTIASDRAEILVVDDDDAVRAALTKSLSPRYLVHTAATGTEALEMFRGRRFALLLVDLELPDIRGMDLLSHAFDFAPDAAIIMLSGTNDATQAARCMQRGAMDYLTKPIDIGTLERAVAQALKQREVWSGDTVSDQEQAELLRQFGRLRRERDKMRRFAIATLETVVKAYEAKDPYAEGHSLRVADLAATMADRLGLPDDEIERIRTAGRLHDLGNIGISDGILTKKDRLTKGEFEHVKEHVKIGARIIESMEPLRHLAPLVRSHHERWDGKGYPDGLAGEAIPLGGRILATVEVYDALTRTQPHQEKLSRSDALACIRQMTGTALDPAIVKALVTVVRDQRTLNFLDGRSEQVA